MIYHFFERWKEVENGVSSIHNDLPLIELEYRGRVLVLEKIFNGNLSPAQLKNMCERLRDKYQTHRIQVLLEIVLKKLREILAQNVFNTDEINNFIQVIYTLLDYTKRENQLAQKILTDIINGKPYYFSILKRFYLFCSSFTS